MLAMLMGVRGGAPAKASEERTGAPRPEAYAGEWCPEEQTEALRSDVQLVRPGPVSLNSLHAFSLGLMAATDDASTPVPSAAEDATRRPVLSWNAGTGSSHLIPALEIPGFIVLVNGYDRLRYGDLTENGKKVYSTNLSTFWDHVMHGPWGFDQDDFKTNQFMHPYQGSIYYGLARSAGLGYWTSFAYTFAGSLLWETAGETTNPSVNDQVASGIAGSFFGESLFRMASRLLESGASPPGFWRELGAAAISPPTGFNRLAFGNRFDDIFPSRSPAMFQRFRVGPILNANASDRSGLGFVTRYLATADYSLSYGLPGKPGYAYERPFDYFEFEFTLVNKPNNIFQDLMTRGLLLGEAYGTGEHYRGIWGLYGSYDYISPHIFRVSTTAFSLGTTFEWTLARSAALQGSVLGGVGYGAAGTVAGIGDRDYHYGATAQGLVALRLLLGELAMLDVIEREYVVSGLGATETSGSEHIARRNVGLSFRLFGRNAIGFEYLGSSRSAHYADRGGSHQSLDAFSVVYTLLSDKRWGRVDWPEPVSAPE